MLETLDDPTIYRMAIEEPENNPPGWFELPEFTETDIKEIKEEVRDASSLGHGDEFNWIRFTEILAHVQAIGIKTGVKNDDLIGIHATLKKFRYKTQWFDFSRLAKGLKEMGEDPEVTNDDLQNIQNEITRFREVVDEGKDNEHVLINLIHYIKILGRDVPLRPREKDYILNKYREQCESSSPYGPWMAYEALRAKEFGIDVALDLKTINFLVSEMERFYRKDWVSFLSLAASLKKLSQFPKETTTAFSPTIPIPDQRKF